MLYKVFAFNNHHIWKMQGEYFINHTGAYLLHVFLILPMSIFIYLSTYPSTWTKRAIHVVKWIFILILVEWIGWKNGRIVYFHGWNLGWSTLFNLNMLIVTRIHYTNYLWALPLATGCTLFFLYVFDYL
ncbi:hypothetical protein ACFPES_14800 [Paenibacillus sp. GCM10023248]|uniref:hypothetical protein n=1 Tax=Bacillales TaxID=1385 RepID=UPI0036139511